MPIVDTSVVLAVLLNEPTAAIANAVLSAHGHDLHAPDVMTLEIANALVNATRSGRLVGDRAAGLLHQVATLPIMHHPTSPLVARALDISLAFQRRPYDGIFLALAEFRRDVLLTLDQRLVNGMKGTPLERFVRILE